MINIKKELKDLKVTEKQIKEFDRIIKDFNLTKEDTVLRMFDTVIRLEFDGGDCDEEVEITPDGETRSRHRGYGKNDIWTEWQTI